MTSHDLAPGSSDMTSPDLAPLRPTSPEANSDHLARPRPAPYRGRGRQAKSTGEVDSGEVVSKNETSVAAEQLTLADVRTSTGRKSRRNTGMTEDDLLRSVRKLCRYTNWLFYHTRWSKGSEPGFPDCVLVSATQRRVVYAELKSTTGRTTPAQELWLDTLSAAGCETALWRPEHLQTSIPAVLRGTPTQWRAAP